ncbi:MAG TPA: replication-associated recombination protein A [Acidobacteriota bacterium]|nr:replication-associated recombination protein A [Acidobacteriota bacterium]
MKNPEAPGLFESENRVKAPLADRMRPRNFEEFLGQENLTDPGRILRRMAEQRQLRSLIFWGPPGTGKTTLARLLAAATQAHFIPYSAVTSGIKEIKNVMIEAQRQRKYYGRQTILFVDEIHRFNKAQQDAFLPYVESGDIILLGATTENPSFEINSALLSRIKVIVLHQLNPEHIRQIILAALEDSERGLGGSRVKLSPEGLEVLVKMANGDARAALNLLEIAADIAGADKDIGAAELEQAFQRKVLLYDKKGEEHYNIISALHKSLRNSDPDAGLYWLARMLEAGEDPMYVARRLVRFASEDVGMADPQALVIAMAAQQATHFIGMPEANTALAQAVIYLATAPKSNALYEGYTRAAEAVHEKPDEPVPLHIRNAPTPLMKNLGYGKGYKYAHNYEDAITDLSCLPDSMAGDTFYTPTERGFEQEVKRRLEEWRHKKQKLAKKD